MAGMTDITSNATPSLVGLTAGTVYNIPLATLAPVLEIQNESPFRLIVGTQNGRGVVAIPPTCVLHDLDVLRDLLDDTAATSGIILTITPEQLTGGTVPTDPTSNQVKVLAYSWTTGRPRITALVRNISGAVAVTTSNILLGTGQTSGLTESDLTINLNPGVNRHPRLAPTTPSPDGAVTPVGLVPLDASGLPVNSAEFSVSPTGFGASTPLSAGGVATLKGVATVGNGVPGIVASTGPAGVHVTTTTASTLSYTPLADGLYRVSVWALVGNGTSGNNVACTVSYKDTTGVARTDTIPFNFSTGTSFPTGSVAIANGHYTCPSQLIPAQAGTAIIVSYRDPTNTPNDWFMAAIEWLH